MIHGNGKLQKRILKIWKMLMEITGEAWWGKGGGGVKIRKAIQWKINTTTTKIAQSDDKTFNNNNNNFWYWILIRIDEGIKF